MLPLNRGWDYNFFVGQNLVIITYFVVHAAVIYQPYRYFIATA
jgi:hypothetical protein